MVISLRLGWRKDHLRPAGSGDPSATPNSVILPHRSPDSGCFALKHPIITCTYICIQHMLLLLSKMSEGILMKRKQRCYKL